MTLDLSGQTVLIVDDEKFSRTIVAHLLEDMGKPEVLQAKNGAEAFDKLDALNGRVRFIIADFNMPVMNGLELLKSIRVGHRDIHRSTPVAMVTGYSEKHLVDLALALDVNAFLIKPVSKEALAKRLARMLSQTFTDVWLKPDDSYEDVEVATALDDIVSGKKKVPERGARRVYIKDPDAPLFRDPVPVPPGQETETDAWNHVLEDEAAKSGHIVEKTATDKPREGYQCALDEIPEGAILAKDVHTADGRLFMHAGALLTPRVVSILDDLRQLDHPVDSVWIVK